MTSPTIRMPRPGPGNGWRRTISSGRPSSGADRADLVLEQRAQRLDELELQVVRQPAHVVVALDVGRAVAAAGLDDVRVERALDEELDVLAVRRRLGDDLAGSASSKTRMNSRPMILRLVLGVADAGERGRGSAPARRRRTSRTPVAATKSRLDLLALALAQQAVVDEDAGQLVADGPLHERRGDRRVDAAGQPADRPGRRRSASRIAVDLLLDDRCRWSSPAAMPATSCRKCSSTCWPCGGVHRPRGATARRRAAARRSSKAATGAPAVDASDREALGRLATTESPWLIHTGCCGGRPACRAPPSSVTVSAVRPYSRVPVWATLPPSAWAIAWKP